MGQGIEVVTRNFTPGGEELGATGRVWHDDRVVEAWSEVVGDGGRRDRCANDPDLVVLRLPLVEGDSWTQRWPDQGCLRSAHIEVKRLERVEDGRGRTHAAWRIEELVAGIDRNVRTTRWLDPTAGIDVKILKVIDARGAAGPVQTRQQTDLLSP